MNKKILMYGTPTCPMVPPVRGMLMRANAPFEYIDISRDAEAQNLVKTINNGNASVPTLAFGDGSTLTEPSLSTLKAKLETLGYQTIAPSLSEIFRENLLKVMPALFLIAIGLVQQEWIWAALGGIILGIVWWNGR